MKQEEQLKEYIDTEDRIQLKEIAKQLDCTTEELLYCIKKVGKTLKSIELFLHMNRDAIECFVQGN